MSVIVAGDNESRQISLKSDRAISPPKPTKIDFTQIISYSVYKNFSVIVLNSGIPCAIGNNTGWSIHESLPRFIKQWTSYSITDNQYRKYFVESAVCGSYYTLYKLRLSSPSNSDSCLALVQKGKLKGKAVFLNTANWIPMSLFGGSILSAAIDERGAIHVIDNHIINNNYQTKVLFLPNNELPISVCFCDDYIISLSGQKVVYEFHLPDYNQNKCEFQRSSELSQIRIKCISGSLSHCVAVSTNGDVYVRGSNKDGQIGLGSDVTEVSKFTLLLSLKGQKIESAFAGAFHSIFVCENGRVFSCGNNRSGELLFDRNVGDVINQPLVTQLTSNAKFCIAGFHTSVVFVDCSPPLNSPNQTLQLKSPYPYPQLFVNNGSSDLQTENYHLMQEINDLKKLLEEKTEASELLQEIVNEQIEEMMKMRKKKNKMKQILKSKQIEIDFDSDDSDDQEDEQTADLNINEKSNENENAESIVTMQENNNNDDDIDDDNDTDFIIYKNEKNIYDDSNVKHSEIKDSKSVSDDNEEEENKSYKTKDNNEKILDYEYFSDNDDKDDESSNNKNENEKRESGRDFDESNSNNVKKDVYNDSDDGDDDYDDNPNDICE